MNIFKHIICAITSSLGFITRLFFVICLGSFVTVCICPIAFLFDLHEWACNKYDMTIRDWYSYQLLKEIYYDFLIRGYFPS